MSSLPASKPESGLGNYRILRAGLAYMENDAL
jgi:hypothetical protein